MISSDLINILLVDDHAIVREGYRGLLEKQASMEIIAEASHGEEGYLLYQSHSPDLVVMDLTLPGQGGLATIEHILKYDTRAKILVFSMHQNPSLALKATLGLRIM